LSHVTPTWFGSLSPARCSKGSTPGYRPPVCVSCFPEIQSRSFCPHGPGMSSCSRMAAGRLSEHSPRSRSDPVLSNSTSRLSDTETGFFPRGQIRPRQGIVLPSRAQGADTRSIRQAARSCSQVTSRHFLQSPCFCERSLRRPRWRYSLRSGILTHASNCPLTRVRPFSGVDLRLAQLLAIRSSPLSPAHRWLLTHGYGLLARRPPSSAFAVISLTSGVFPAPTLLSGATGSTAAAAWSKAPTDMTGGLVQ